MIHIYIDGADFQIKESTLAQAIATAIPDFVKHEDVPAPTDLADMIRTALVGASALFMKDLLTFVYGPNAPEIPLRADKLPYLVMAFIDLVIGTLKRYQLEFSVDETDQDGVFRVGSYSAKPLSPARQAELAAADADCGCGGGQQASAATTEQSGRDEAPGVTPTEQPATAE